VSNETLRAFSAEATRRALYRTGNEHVYAFDLHGKTTLYAEDLAKVIADRDDLLAALEAAEAFIRSEYTDEWAQALSGELLAKPARETHATICTAIAKAKGADT
jgi:hypothetical protein